MLSAIAAWPVVAVPPVPSLVPIFKGVSTSTANEDTTTFSGLDLGTAHPHRVIVACVYHGVAAACTARLNGQPAYVRVQNTAHEPSIHLFRFPHGTIGAVEISATSSIRKLLGLYVFYPRDPYPLDSGTATAAAANDATITNQAAMKGGALFYVGGQIAATSTWTTTWSGGDAVVEDHDAALEAASGLTCGHVKIAALSTVLDDVTFAGTASGTKRFAAVSLGPPIGV